MALCPIECTAFIVLQFIGFAGNDLADCQAFLAVYLSMVFSIVNLAVMNHISSKFAKGENPYSYGTTVTRGAFTASSSNQNPIRFGQELGGGNIQVCSQ